VGIGTTIAAIAANAPNYKLAVAGTIGAKEVVVEVVSGMWPDYVFEKDYPLAPLDSVAAFVKANKHLPEVPSATEVENNGVQLGEMNMLLLKKIEELTLYVIDQNKKIADQQMQIQAQQVQIGALINEIKK
jgi:hypothetical protein